MGESPGGIFAATAHTGARFSSYFHILFTSRTLQNSHLEVLCLWKHHCTWKNQMWKNVLGGKKTGPKKKEMVPFCQEKKKNSFVKAVGTGGAPRWRPDLELRRSPSNQHLPYVMVIIVSSSSTLHWALRRTTSNSSLSTMGYFSREILIHPHWRREVPLPYWFAENQ